MKRRLFASLLAATPAVATVAAVPAPVAETPPPPPDNGWLMNFPEATELQKTISKALRPADDAWHEDENRRSEIRSYYAGSHLDPDIAALKSLSPIRKAQIQYDRDKAREAAQRSLRARIIRSLGGDPEAW